MAVKVSQSILPCRNVGGVGYPVVCEADLTLEVVELLLRGLHLQHIVLESFEACGCDELNPMMHLVLGVPEYRPEGCLDAEQ